MSTVALIPARGGSKGLKRKNIIDLAGSPLIAYSIQSALECNLIDRVIVSTDDEEIARTSVDFGAEVPFIRPDYLSNDTAKSIDVISHAIRKLEEEGTTVDNIVLLQPTSPLRTSEHITEALTLFFEKGRSPVVSVAEAQTHPFIVKKVVDQKLEDFVSDKPAITRRQDFEKLFQLNGAIYATTKEMVLEKNTIYDEVVYPYYMDKLSSVDIDDEYDLVYAETLLNKYFGGNIHG